MGKLVLKLRVLRHVPPFSDFFEQSLGNPSLSLLRMCPNITHGYLMVPVEHWLLQSTASYHGPRCNTRWSSPAAGHSLRHSSQPSRCHAPHQSPPRTESRGRVVSAQRDSKKVMLAAGWTGKQEVALGLPLWVSLAVPSQNMLLVLFVNPLRGIISFVPLLQMHLKTAFHTHLNSPNELSTYIKLDFALIKFRLLYILKLSFRISHHSVALILPVVLQAYKE